MLIEKTFTFEASHQIHNHPGKCARLHGHSWKLKVGVDGEINPETGMVMDYADIKKAVQPLVDRLDHQHLGEGFVEHFINGVVHNLLLETTVQGLPINGWLPTSENLLMWIGDQLFLQGFEWSYLSLDETCTSSAFLPKEEYLRVRKIIRWKGAQPNGNQEAEETWEDERPQAG